ncbi:MAG: EFR1 family ferrodoxin [Bacteroidota bacterium]
MIAYKKLIVYYFSGTGNAKRASEWIIDVAKEQSIDVELININGFKFKKTPYLEQRTLIGLCSPTHGFNLPPIMLKFIYNFPKVNNADFFILNTRAGMKLYKIFLPGLSGVAQILPTIYLKLKGYKVVGMQPMDLPSNWISLHPGLRKKVIHSIFERCEKITKSFANKILNGKKVYKALLSLPIDLAISPISLAYYFFGRFVIAKTFISTDACTNCGLCQKNCPVNAIEKINDQLYWTFDCESCMHCMNYCPQRAIETAHSFTFLIWWVAFSVLPMLAVNQAVKNEFWNIQKGTSRADILYYFVEFAGGLLIIYLAYRFLHYLMRFKFFNKLIAYTSLTKYRFWRRYKAPV